VKNSVYALSVYGFACSHTLLFIGANKPSEMDPILFVPLLDHSIFPASLKKFFRFGVAEKHMLDINKNKNEYLSDLDKEMPRLLAENGTNYNTSKV